MLNFTMFIRKNEMNNLIVFTLMREFDYKLNGRNVQMPWATATKPLVYNFRLDMLETMLEHDPIGWFSDY